jgi:hypothetical protein
MNREIFTIASAQDVPLDPRDTEEVNGSNERKNESIVRNLVKEILQEDMKGFKERTANLDYVGTMDDPTFEEFTDMKPMAREVKRAWAAEADHGFMKSLIKVHWVNTWHPKKIEKFMSLSGKNEISAMGYLPGRGRIESFWGDVGIMIQGRVTLAANDMDALYTGYHGEIPNAIQRKYSSSGTPRRAMQFFDRSNDIVKGSEHYILDRSTFKERMQGHNELIVDNWKPIGIIIGLTPEGISDSVKRGVFSNGKLIETLLGFGLPIYHLSMKPIPAEKLRAALRGEVEVEDFTFP